MRYVNQDIIKQLNLDQYFEEERNKIIDQLEDLLEKEMLDLVLSKLSDEDSKKFLELLEGTIDTTALDFVKQKVPNFEEELKTRFAEVIKDVFGEKLLAPTDLGK